MLRTLIVVSALFAVPALAQGAEEKAVLQAMVEWCAAAQKSDAAALERILLDDYTLTNSKGQISTKADDIAEAKKVDPQYELLENRDMKVRIHGNTAVVTGRTVVKGLSGGKAFSANFQFTDTLIKVQGKWRPLASHVSRVGD
ncbi:nuclear transport factor 2 family protein [Archangium lansingense]|uniref:Nuclear transport factor 2 family protein n=1 Tax=Archangium lansingense TaxID=2995310 RepID=A0ABT4A3W4_9BACT|nr:nuclear transport factor 2 family protein [Archangium lansinium]MCY1076301.1 nuclear transport factor 2 family protein [Archangium lansinium]